MLYDEELMIKDIESALLAELNNQIDCINTEKNDSLTIPHIPADKYIFETLDKRLLNYTGFFLFYGLVDTPVKEQNIESEIEDVTINVSIGYIDRGEKILKDTLYKLLRYRRALKAVIKKKPDLFRGYAKPLIGSLKPDAFPYSKQKVIIRIGIDVQASVTSN